MPGWSSLIFFRVKDQQHKRKAWERGYNNICVEPKPATAMMNKKLCRPLQPCSSQAILTPAMCPLQKRLHSRVIAVTSTHPLLSKKTLQRILAEFFTEHIWMYSDQVRSALIERQHEITGSNEVLCSMWTILQKCCQKYPMTTKMEGLHLL